MLKDHSLIIQDNPELDKLLALSLLIRCLSKMLLCRVKATRVRIRRTDLYRKSWSLTWAELLLPPKLKYNRQQIRNQGKDRVLQDSRKGEAINNNSKCRLFHPRIKTVVAVQRDKDKVAVLWVRTNHHHKQEIAILEELRERIYSIKFLRLRLISSQTIRSRRAAIKKRTVHQERKDRLLVLHPLLNNQWDNLFNSLEEQLEEFTVKIRIKQYKNKIIHNSKILVTSNLQTVHRKPMQKVFATKHQQCQPRKRL